ncbi:hypothetical protein AWB69_03111 [Caballeronia udeis]|uniref:DUF1018 domain-containing protein n=1 Tax=Caballeronia udeis TaxID=1232866 RepID=A0A158GQH5_9BURK|nr:regulatory protein GemA [Caballeronia udeis]SAL34173.1 hypothetical protein AWB69_03111 [Caballeronia udeis]
MLAFIGSLSLPELLRLCALVALTVGLIFWRAPRYPSERTEAMKLQTTAQRARDIQLIRAARRELNLSEHAYRDLMKSVTGQRSARDLNDNQLHRFIECLKKIVSRPKHVDQDDSHDPLYTEARALWHTLALAGQVDQDTDDAFNAYVKLEVGTDHWRLLNDHQRIAMVERLKGWVRRSELS